MNLAHQAVTSQQQDDEWMKDRLSHEMNSHDVSELKQ